MDAAAARPGPLEFVKELGEELSNGKLKLPSFPDAVARIKKELDDPSCSVERVATVVSLEPVLAAKLLRMANSALLHRGEERVTDPRLAISRLGLDAVRSSAIALATQQLMKSEASAPVRAQLKAIWEHSVQVAAYSHVIAKRHTRINPNEAMLAGLVHDIGKIYILLKAKSYPELFSAHDQFDAIAMEWHAPIGRAILEVWHLSDEVLEAVDEHECLDVEHVGGANLTDVVVAANVHAHIELGDIPEGVHIHDLPVWHRLHLDVEASGDLMRRSRDELRAIHAALGV